MASMHENKRIKSVRDTSRADPAAPGFLIRNPKGIPKNPGAAGSAREGSRTDLVLSFSTDRERDHTIKAVAFSAYHAFFLAVLSRVGAGRSSRERWIGCGATYGRPGLRV